MTSPSISLMMELLLIKVSDWDEEVKANKRADTELRSELPDFYVSRKIKFLTGNFE